MKRITGYIYNLNIETTSTKEVKKFIARYTLEFHYKMECSKSYQIINKDGKICGHITFIK